MFTIWTTAMYRVLMTALLFAFAACLCTPTAAMDESPQPGAPSPKPVRVAGIVLKWLKADKAANCDRAAALIREAATGGAQIVCTTECCLDGYAITNKDMPLDAYRALGEQVPGGPYYERLAKLADELDIHLCAGMLEADGDRRFNTAAMISPAGELIGKYRKHELGHELVRNTPGDALPVFETLHGRIGLMICADRRNPDLVGRLKENGAELLICPSGGMFGPKSNDPILQARSLETGLPIVFVHPAEFLVTGPGGVIERCELLGDTLTVNPDEVGTERDSRQVYFFEVTPVQRVGIPATTP